MTWVALFGAAIVVLAAGPAEAQTTYTWNKTGSADWTNSGNWLPTRSSPANTDIIVINGATTPAPIIQKVPNQTIGRLRFIGNVNARLESAGAVTLTISGTTNPAFDLAAGSTVTLAGSGGRPITLAMGNSSQALIAGSLVFTVNSHALTSSTAGNIQVTSTGSVTAGTSYTGSAFGTSGTAGVAVFQSGARYIHVAGNNPFGLTFPSSRVVFNAGSKQFWQSTAGFQTDGRTYANLSVQNNTALSAAGASGTFTVDTLTVELGSSFTHTGSSTGSVAIKGDVTSAGTGNIAITPGSGGIQLNGGKVQTIGGGGGTGTITFGGNATVAVGTTVALSRTLTFSTGAMTVNGTFRFNQAGAVSGGGNFVYGAGSTLDFAQTSGSYAVLSTSTFWPTTNGPPNVSVGSAGITMNAGATRTVSGTLTAGGPITSANLLTIGATGSLLLNTGGSVSAPPTYVAGATLRYGAPFTVGVEWGAGAAVGAGVPNHVTIQAAGTVSLPASLRTVPGNLTITSGTLAMNAAGDLNVGGNWSNTGTFTPNGRFVTFTGSATQTLSKTGGESLVTLKLAKSGGSVQLLSALTLTPTAGTNALEMNGTVDVLDLNGQTLTLNGPLAGTDASGSIKGSATSNLSLAGAGALGTLRMTAGSQSLGNLTLNASGASGAVILGTPVTVNGTLALTAGVVTTGANALVVGSAGTVTRTAGWVNGGLTRRIPTGAPTLVHDIGNATNYLPVTTLFANVTVAGDLAISTASGEHASIATSGLDATKSVNRTWTLAGAGITFASYAATFTFAPGDVDAGTTTDSLEARRFSAGLWSTSPLGARTATTTQSLQLAGFGDFAIGEPKTHTITASAGANGSIAPSGAVTVRNGRVAFFKMTPNVGYHVQDVVVDGGSVGAVTTYQFVGVVVNHTISVSFAIDLYTLTTAVNGLGSVGRDQAGPTYPYHTLVTLTANPAQGNEFVAWSGDLSSTSNPVGVFVDSNMTVTATFQRVALAYTRTTFNAGYSSISTGTGAQRLFTTVADDSTQTIPLPFNFTFSGLPFSTSNFLAVNANGFAYLSRAAVTTSSPTLANNTSLFLAGLPGAVLAPWYDDLAVAPVGTNPAGSVLYQTQGAAGFRTLTVQWTNVSSNNLVTGGQPRRVNFQLILYEASQFIEFRYGALNGSTYSNLESGSIGLKDSVGGPGNYIDGITGSKLTSVSMMTTNKWPARHIRFSPGKPAPLAAGTYAVGSGGNYVNLTDAVADLNQRGVSGPVTFQLTDAAYDSSAANGANLFPTLIGPVAGTSAVNTVTFTSSIGSVLGYRGVEAGTCGNQSISNAITTTNEPIVGLVGADWVTLDGLSFSGGNLVDRAVLVLPSASNDGAQHNTLSNLGVTLNRGNTSSIGIQQSVSSAPSDAGGTNSDNRYLNLNVQNAYAGMSIAGNASLFDSGVLVSVTNGGQTIVGGAAAGDIGNGTPSSFGLRASNQRDLTIDGIQVRSVQGTSTGTVDGIVLDNPAASGLSNGTCVIANSQVSGLASTSVSGGRVSAIRVNLTSHPSSVARVYNNFVTGLQSASTATSSRRVVGIMVQDAVGGTGATLHADFNSVRLEASPALCSNACFEAGTTSGPVINTRNNIFANVTGTQTGGAKHYGWVSPTAGALGAVGSSSDYNVIYVANPANGYVGYAASDKSALSDWRTVAANDAHSLSADPQFTSATNLHVRTDIPTPASQQGAYVAGAPSWVTTDIDGQARNNTTPDIGADEGNFQILTTKDISAVAFVDPADGATKNAGSAFSPQATFLNGGTDPQTSIPVRYRILGPLPDTTTVLYNQTATIASLASGAQQTVTFPSATIPNGGTYRIEATAQLAGDLNTPNDKKVGVVDMVGPLNGTYSVGSGQPAPFNSLTNAVGRLNLAGATGPVVFQLVSASYGASETFPININAYPGNGATNTLTIRPAAGVTATMTGSTNRALIVLNGADYITIDGSMTPGGTTRDLTLANTAATNGSAVVWGQTSSGGDPATHNTVKNAVLVGSDMNQTLFGVGFGSLTIALVSNGAGNVANRVENCDIRRVQYGIYSAGLSAASRNTGTIIRGNVLESSGASAIGVGGIYVRYEDGVQIDHNHIGNLSNNVDASMFGISLGLPEVSSVTWAGADVTNANVHHNTIHGILQTNGQGLSAAGIIVADSPSGITTIANNMITGLSSPAFDPDMTVGILVGGGAASTRVLFNSVAMTGIRGTAAGPSFCLAIGGSNPVVDVRNNIFYTSQFNNGVGDNYLIGLNYQLVYSNLTSDYNDLYGTANSLFVVGGMTNTPDGDQANVAAWKLTTGKDANSVAVNPGFVDATSNLHVTSVGSPVANIGQVVAGIVDDIDDEPGLRASTPDIGADEFTAYNLTVNVTGQGTVGIVPNLPSYPTGVVVQLNAAALANYHFVGWSGGLTGNANPASVTMTSNKVITAVFALDSFTVAATASDGHGTASRSPNQAQYEFGTPVTFTATPSFGYHFNTWTGDTTTTQNPYSIVVTRTRAVDASFGINNYVVTTGQSGSGTLTRIPNLPSYDHGTLLKLAAVAAPNFTFIGWNGDTSATGDTLSVIVTRARSINAVFAPNICTLTVGSDPNGTVNVVPNQATYNQGTLVTLTATPNTNYHFAGWTGDTTATTNPLQVRLQRNRTINPTFAFDTYAVAVSILGEGTVERAPNLASYPLGTPLTLTAHRGPGQTFLGWAGDTTATDSTLSLVVRRDRSLVAKFTAAVTVTVVGSGTVTKQPDQTAFPLGSAVLLTANSAVGWHFIGWTGDTTTTNNPISLAVPTSRAVTATFQIDMHTLALSTIGNGGAAAVPATGPYPYGTQVDLTATPAPGNAFVGWTGDASGSSPTTSVILTADRTVTAVFTWQLSVTSAGPGTAAASPVQANYAPGTIVTLTGTPVPHAHFVSWSGDTATSTTPIAIAMKANRSFTGTFAPDAYALGITIAGNGAVSRAPDLPQYDHGTPVTLTATPDPYWHFIAWTGDTTAGGNPITVPMTAARAIVANFAIDTHVLTVSAGPNGQVAKSPDETTYDHGTSVTVAATPDVGYHFTLWSGDTLSSDNPLTFHLVTDRSLTASFAPNMYPLTNDVTGSGTVLRSPDLPVYSHGSSVTLTATPATGWHFLGWTGDTTTSANPVTIVMTHPTTVDPVFEINTYPLTLGVPGGHGGITTLPSLAMYPHGTIVELQADPDPGYSFASWGGDAKGTDPVTQISMEGPRSATAVFSVQTFPVNVTVFGPGTVTKSPNQAEYPVGTPVQLTAAPSDTSHHFTRWTGAVVGTNPVITVPAVYNMSVNATFEENFYTVSTGVQGSGTAIRVPSGTIVYHGSTIQLTATPQDGFQFAGWQGSLAGLVNPIAFPVDSNMAITAQFVPGPPPTLTTSTAGAGSVTRNPDLASYAPGSLVTLTATPSPDWLFDGWSGDLVAGATPITVMMDRNKTIVAHFRPNGALLTVLITGPGTVPVYAGATVHPPGSLVHLQAQPQAGASFVSWAGDTAALKDTLSLRLDRDRTVRAQFGYTLALRDTALGSIQAMPAGSKVVAGSTVTLVPKPVPGAFFAGWLGDATGATVPLVVTMNGNRVYGAVFRTDLFAITATASPHGAVFREPNLPSYAYGAHVRIMAVPDSNYHFTHWTQDFRPSTTDRNPDDCPVCTNPQGSPLDVRVVRDLGIIGHFERDTFIVVTSVIGGGSVTKRWVEVPGPDMTVVLTAEADEGWTFAGWSGGASGQTNPLRLDLTGDLEVIARFAREGEALAVEPVAVSLPLALAPVSPNPAVNLARFEFSLPAAMSVQLQIVDVQGRVVARVADGVFPAGRHQASWNGTHADGRSPAGVFFARLSTPQGVLTRRFALTR